MATKIAVVTGSNRGIGYGVVKALLERHPSWIVYLTSTDRFRGIEAVQRIAREIDVLPAYHDLDICSVESIREFKNHLRNNHNRIDILVNNAGIFPKQLNLSSKCFSYDVDIVQKIIKTNYFGTLNVCKHLTPLMSSNSRIVNISSSLSQLAFSQFSGEIQRVFRSHQGVEDISNTLNAFMTTDPTDYVKSGWMAKLFDEQGYFYGDVVPYGLSKLGVNLLTRIYQSHFLRSNGRPNYVTLVNSCSPGSVQTDSNPNGIKSVAQAAEVIANLATIPKNSTLRGLYLHDRRIEDPFTGISLRY